MWIKKLEGKKRSKKMKKSKLTKKILSLCLTAILSLGMVASVLAADPVVHDEDNPAQAAISKILQMPEGTTTPDAEFEFEFTAVSVDEGTAPVTDAPEISGKVEFTDVDAGTSEDGTKTVRKDSANVFDGVDFPHAGTYVYDITEKGGTYTTETGETMTYSGAQYQMTVWVANGENGLYVKAVAAKIVLGDDGEPGTDAGEKVDPTPGGDGSDPMLEYSSVAFTNIFTKQVDGGNPEDPDAQMLNINKTVVGDYADKTKYFAYDITVTQPELVTGIVTYKAYIVDETGVVTSGDNYPVEDIQPTDDYGPFINVTAGLTVTINIKHGQQIVFTDTHIGATYEVVEAAYAGYTPEVELVVNGAEPVNTKGTEETTLSTGSNLLGEDENSAAFTNTYKNITPTGILINNLPFIILALVVLGGLVVSVALKAKKRGYEN